MKKFLVQYTAPAEAFATMAAETPEEKEAGMKVWMDWKDSMGETLVDFGTPLKGVVHRLNSDGSDTYTQSESCGYSIITANNIDEAKEILKSHPHLEWAKGVGIEIFESYEL